MVLGVFLDHARIVSSSAECNPGIKMLPHSSRRALLKFFTCLLLVCINTTINYETSSYQCLPFLCSPPKQQHLSCPRAMPCQERDKEHCCQPPSAFVGSRTRPRIAESGWNQAWIIRRDPQERIETLGSAEENVLFLGIAYPVDAVNCLTTSSSVTFCHPSL